MTFVAPQVQRVCVECGATFQARWYDVRRGFGKACSKRCAGLIGGRERAKTLDQFGEKNPHYKHGLSRTPELRKEYVRRTDERYPLPRTARQAVSNAVRAGRLTKTPCEICGDVQVHGHHEDYAKPLEVRWLCARCHKAEHVALAKKGISISALTGSARKKAS